MEEVLPVLAGEADAAGEEVTAVTTTVVIPEIDAAGLEDAVGGAEVEGGVDMEGADELEGADADNTGADDVPLLTDPSVCPGGAVGGGGVPKLASRSLPVPHGMASPSGWLAFGGEVVAPLASEMAKRPVQLVF